MKAIRVDPDVYRLLADTRDRMQRSENLRVEVGRIDKAERMTLADAARHLITLQGILP